MKNWVFGRHKDEGPAWPTDDEGKAVPQVVAAQMPDGQLMADTALNMLHACGIPARLHYPGDGGFGRIVLGASGFGVEIMVPEDRLEEARALLLHDASSEADEESSEQD